MLRYAKHLILLIPVLITTVALVTAKDDPRCAGFQRASGGDRVISTYSWTSVADIDEYKVNFYGTDGQFVTSYWVLPPKTALDVNLGDLATGPYFQWEVEALENGGQKVCNTGRSKSSPLPHDRPTPIPVVVTATPDASLEVTAEVTPEPSPTKGA